MKFRARIALPLELAFALLSMIIGASGLYGQGALHELLTSVDAAGFMSNNEVWGAAFILPAVGVLFCSGAEWRWGHDWDEPQLRRHAMCRHVLSVAMGVISCAGAWHLAMTLQPHRVLSVFLTCALLALVFAWCAIQTRRVWAVLNERIPTSQMQARLRRGHY